MLCIAPTVIYILPQVSGFKEQHVCMKLCLIGWNSYRNLWHFKICVHEQNGGKCGLNQGTSSRKQMWHYLWL